MARNVYDDSKIDAVRNYLVHEFPNLRPVVFRDKGMQCFRLDESGMQHLVIVTLEFFHFNAVEDIPAILERFGLAEALREAGRSPVLVMTNGLRGEE